MVVKALFPCQNQTTLSQQHNNVLNHTQTTIQFQAPSMLTNTTLWQQRDGDRLLCDIALRIRQSLDFNTMLQTTVDEVRQFLDTDRVLVFRFHPDLTGTVKVESVGSDWLSIRSTTISVFSKKKPENKYLI